LTLVISVFILETIGMLMVMIDDLVTGVAVIFDRLVFVLVIVVNGLIIQFIDGVVVGGEIGVQIVGMEVVVIVEVVVVVVVIGIVRNGVGNGGFELYLKSLKSSFAFSTHALKS